IARFSLDRINKKSAIFEPEKLVWMNSQHIMLTPADELVELMKPQLLAEGLTTEAELEDRADWFAAIAELVKSRGRTLNALVDQTRLFLAPGVEYDPAAVAKAWKDPAEAAERLRIALDALEALENWGPEEIEATLR